MRPRLVLTGIGLIAVAACMALLIGCNGDTSLTCTTVLPPPDSTATDTVPPDDDDLDLFLKKTGYLRAIALQRNTEDYLEGKPVILRGGNSYPEDGDLRLRAFVDRRAGTVEIFVDMRDTSAWWLDEDWADRDWPGIPLEELPITSIAALGLEVQIDPEDSLDLAAGAGRGSSIFDGACTIDSEPGPGPRYCYWGANVMPGGSVRMGGFVIDMSYEDPPGNAYLLNKGQWYNIGSFKAPVSEGFSGLIELKLIGSSDDIGGIHEMAPSIVIRAGRRASVVRI